ncbi:MAG: hypothetical protein ACRDJE_18265 [Dehalococcoidia bacterium]
MSRGSGSCAESEVRQRFSTVATALRVGGALLEGQGLGADRYWPMALGGGLAIIAIAAFAVAVLRAARHEPPQIILRERRPS